MQENDDQLPKDPERDIDSNLTFVLIQLLFPALQHTLMQLSEIDALKETIRAWARAPRWNIIMT